MSKCLNVYVSDKEYESIKNKARNYGTSISTLIKDSYFMGFMNDYDDRVRYAKKIVEDDEKMKERLK